MRTVYEAENLIDAHLMRGRLQSEGIHAFVRGEFLTGALGELPMQGLIQVCVTDYDWPAAQDLMTGWAAQVEPMQEPLDDLTWGMLA